MSKSNTRKLLVQGTKSRGKSPNPLDKDLVNLETSQAQALDSNNPLDGLSDDELERALLNAKPTSVMLNRFGVNKLLEVAKHVDGVKISDGILVRKLLEDFFDKTKDEQMAFLREAAEEEVKRRKIRATHKAMQS